MTFIFIPLKVNHYRWCWHHFCKTPAFFLSQSDLECPIVAAAVVDQNTKTTQGLLSPALKVCSNFTAQVKSYCHVTKGSLSSHSCQYSSVDAQFCYRWEWALWGSCRVQGLQGYSWCHYSWVSNTSMLWATRCLQAIIWCYCDQV